MDEFVPPAPELEIEVYFLTTKEGGRKHNISLNYRGQFYYDGGDYDALYQFISKRPGILGENTRLLVQFLSPFFHAGQFYEGKEILIREGYRVVGRGKVIRIFDDNLRIWDPGKIIESFEGKIEPYEGDNMTGFKMDLDMLGYERDTLEAGDLIETGDRENMLIVKCNLLNQNARVPEVVEEIQSDWLKKLSFHNQRHRFDINMKNENEWEVKMHFMTWQSLYITGTIEIAKKE